MAKYNFHEFKRDGPQRYALVRATMGLSKEQKDRLNYTDSGTVHIQLIVEGVEVDFMEFVERYIPHINTIAAVKARSIIRDKLNRSFNVLNSIADYVEAELDALSRAI